MKENSVTFTTLPPELINKVFSFLREDIDQLILLTKVCKLFKEIVVNEPFHVKIPIPPDHMSWIQDSRVQVRSVDVVIPLSPEEMSWIQENEIKVRSLVCEKNSWVHTDQIYSLDLENLKVARLPVARYEHAYDVRNPRKPKISEEYMKLVHHILEKSKNSLTKFDLAVDLQVEDDKFRFIRILQQFPQLSYLTLHFGWAVYDYEWNMSTVNDHGLLDQIRDCPEMFGLQQGYFREFREDPQRFMDILLEKLPQLKTFYIYTSPTNRLSVSHNNLVEFGVMDSDVAHVRFEKLDLPKVEKIIIFDHFGNLDAALRHEWYQYPGLVSILYNCCPKLKNLSGLLLSSEGMAGDNRMEMEDWGKKIIGTLTLWKIIPGQVKDFI